MSYTNKQYTNPGWNNSAPPPLNQSNLNDISNAIQALNISVENRTTLGISDTQDMQDVLVSLKNTLTTTTEALGNQIESLATLATNSYTKILTGSYVGNGQTTVRVPWPNKDGKDFDEVKLVFVYNTELVEYIMGIGAFNKIFYFYGYNQRGDYYGTYQMWLDDPSYCFKAECDSGSEYTINRNSKTYNYILLG